MAVIPGNNGGSGGLNHVSDDEEEDNNLILAGEEQSDDENSPRLDPQDIDSSLFATMALQEGLIPVLVDHNEEDQGNNPDEMDDYSMLYIDGNEQREEEVTDMYPDGEEVSSSSSSEGAAPLQKLIGLAVKSHWKVIMFVVVLVLSIITIQQVRQENARLKQDNKRMEEEMRRLKSNQDSWHETGEEWMVADNCYFKARLGDCASKKWEEVNSYVELLWSDDGDEASGEPNMASFAQAFSEASYATAQFMTSAPNHVSQWLKIISDGVQATLHDVSACADEAINVIVEQTRDAVEGGTAYARPKNVQQ